MQRIDENTYIDDTLVTCAEYQLFIDEMREQGKYYQPDHWTSYEFPAGQAREPILGVRQSDAIAFCEWLTNREAGKWFYRLPSQDEVNKLSLKDVAKQVIGYWVMGSDRFVWVNPAPVEVSRTETHIYQNGITSYSDVVTVKRFFMDLDSTTSDDPNIERILTRNLDDDYGFALHIHETHVTKSVLITREQALDNLLNMAKIIGPPANEILYRNLTTLKERIAGRYPAFEGIRLVKERIR